MDYLALSPVDSVVATDILQRTLRLDGQRLNDLARGIALHLSGRA